MFSKYFIFSPPSFSAPCAGHPPPEDTEQQAALLLACSGDTLPAPLPPVSMYDLFEALQVTNYWLLKVYLNLCVGSKFLHVYKHIQ